MPETPKAGAHYITLKEAAKISGYSPDYLGQLIRGGKLAGKQIYLNVAWVTTEKALKEYLKDNKVGGAKVNSRKNIQGRMRRWFVAHSSGDEIVKFARKVLFVILLFLVALCLFLVYALFANLSHGVTLP